MVNHGKFCQISEIFIQKVVIHLHFFPIFNYSPLDQEADLDDHHLQHLYSIGLYSTQLWLGVIDQAHYLHSYLLLRGWFPVTKFLSWNILLDPNHLVFKSGQSTGMAQLAVTETETSQSLVLLQLDLTTVFNTVNDCLQLSLCSNIDISGKMLSQFESILTRLSHLMCL